MFFSSKKGEFDRFFNRLDRPVEESRPDRQPDRFPSLVCGLKDRVGCQNKLCVNSDDDETLA